MKKVLKIGSTIGITVTMNDYDMMSLSWEPVDSVVMHISAGQQSKSVEIS